MLREPRFIVDVSYDRLGPFECFGFTTAVCSHLAVGGVHVGVDDVRPGEFIDETADSTGTDSCVQTVVDFLGNRDRQLLRHIRIVYVCGGA